MKKIILILLFSSSSFSQISERELDTADKQTKEFNDKFFNKSTLKHIKRSNIDPNTSKLKTKVTEAVTKKLIIMREDLKDQLEIKKPGDKNFAKHNVAYPFSKAWAGYVHNIEDYIEYYIYSNKGKNLDGLKQWLNKNKFVLKVWLDRCKDHLCKDRTGSTSYKLDLGHKVKEYKLYL